MISYDITKSQVAQFSDTTIGSLYNLIGASVTVLWRRVTPVTFQKDRTAVDTHHGNGRLTITPDALCYSETFPDKYSSSMTFLVVSVSFPRNLTVRNIDFHFLIVRYIFVLQHILWQKPIPTYLINLFVWVSMFSVFPSEYTIKSKRVLDQQLTLHTKPQFRVPSAPYV